MKLFLDLSIIFSYIETKITMFMCNENIITDYNQRSLEIFCDIAGIEGLSGNEKEISSYIKSFLGKLSLKPFEDNSAKKTGSNTGNIICKINGGGNFLISCHIDTARSTQGLKTILSEDRITSDGNTVLGVDNRVGVALLLSLAEKIVKEKLQVKDFTLAFVTCEETTLDGSKYLEIDRNIKRVFVFDSQNNPGEFINSSYGAVGFKIEIIGKASHSGISPEKGINAFEIMTKALNGQSFGRIQPDLTFNIGKFSGGTATNVIPDNIILEGEMRSTNLETVEKRIEELKSRFENAAKKLNGKVNFEWKWDFVPFNIIPESETFQLISDAIKKVGLTPEAVISAGGSDANSYNSRGIEAVNIGIGAKNPHSNDEFILYKDFQNAFNIVLELVKE
jgi:tripeptide aminopeptidase